MESSFKNVYVIVPHIDDGELGASGLTSKLMENGANVYCFFSATEQSLSGGFPRDILKTKVISAILK